MSANFEAMVKIGATDAGASAAIDKVNKSLKDTAQTGQMSAKAIANAYRQLPAQFQDIGVSLAGGQNPLMVLLQQGSQIATQFGGVGAAFKAVTGLITPFRAAVGGAAAVFGTLGLALYEGGKQSNQLKNQLELLGGTAGITAGKVEQAISRLDAMDGVTSGEARDIVTSLLGKFDPSIIDAASRSIAKLANMSGKSKEEVTKDFASMADGVAQWAAKSNKSFNYLTAEQFKYIKNLEEMGRKEDAIRENTNLFNKAMETRTENLGYLEKAWRGVGNAASWAFNAMAGWGRDSTPEEELEKVQKRLRLIERGEFFGMVKPSPQALESHARYQELKQQESILQSAIRESAKAAAAARVKARAEQRKIEKIQSGEDAAIADAERERLLALERATSDANIRIIEERLAAISALRDSGLMDEREYAKQKLALTRADLDEQIRVVNKEIELEEKRKAIGADAIKQQTKLIELSEKLQALVGRKGVEDIKTGGELGALDFKDAQESNKRAQEGIERFLKTYKDASEDIQQLVLANAEAAADLVVDPMERARMQLQAEFSKIDAKYKELRDSLMNQRDIAGAAGNFRRSDELQALIDQLDEAIKKSKELAKQKGPATDWLDAAKRGLNDYVTTAVDVASQTQAAFTKAFQGLETMLTDFFMTGKLNFKEFARSIIQDMIQIMIRTQITGPLAKALGGGDLLSSLLAGFGGPKAAGGPVDGGKTYLVGEKGPELFTARTNGTIIPNHALGGNSNTNNVVVNVSVEGGQAEVRGDQGAGNLGRLIAGAVKAELINQKRPGGLLAA